MTLMQSQITFDILFKICNNFILTLHACFRSCAHQRSTWGHFCKDVTSHVTGKSLNSDNEKFPVIFVTHNSAKAKTFRCFSYTQQPKRKDLSVLLSCTIAPKKMVCVIPDTHKSAKAKVLRYTRLCQKLCSPSLLSCAEHNIKAFRYLRHANRAKEKGFALPLSC